MVEKTQIQNDKRKIVDIQKISEWVEKSNIFNLNSEEMTEDQRSIILVTESGTRIVIEEDTERNFFKYYCIFSFNPQISEKLKLDLVNTLNSNVIFSRFSIPKPEILVSDYFIFRSQVNQKILINSLHLFEMITLNAIQRYDKKDLIQ